MEKVISYQASDILDLNKGKYLVQLKSNNGSQRRASIPSSLFFGNSLKRKVKSKSGETRTSAEVDAQKQTTKDKWKGLAFDTSDDQQDITRGKGMVDSLFQAPIGTGTHYAVMSSYEYISAGLRQ